MGVLHLLIVSCFVPGLPLKGPGGEEEMIFFFLIKEGGKGRDRPASLRGGEDGAMGSH